MGVCVDTHVCAWDFLAGVCGCFVTVTPAPYAVLASCLCTYTCILAWQVIIFLTPFTCLELGIFKQMCFQFRTLDKDCIVTLKRATYFWYASTTKPYILQTCGAESPPCSWWPLISLLLFISGSDAMEVYVGGAALWGPQPGPPFMWSGPTWSGIWPGPVGPRLGAVSWSAASLECQTFEVRLVKKERRVVGVWSNRPLCLK